MSWKGKGMVYLRLDSMRATWSYIFLLPPVCSDHPHMAQIVASHVAPPQGNHIYTFIVGHSSTEGDLI